MAEQSIAELRSEVHDSDEQLHRRIDELALALGKLARICGQLPLQKEDRIALAEIRDLASDARIQQRRSEGNV